MSGREQLLGARLAGCARGPRRPADLARRESAAVRRRRSRAVREIAFPHRRRAALSSHLVLQGSPAGDTTPASQRRQCSSPTRVRTAWFKSRLIAPTSKNRSTTEKNG